MRQMARHPGSGLKHGEADLAAKSIHSRKRQQSSANAEGGQGACMFQGQAGKTPTDLMTSMKNRFKVCLLKPCFCSMTNVLYRLKGMPSTRSFALSNR